MSGGIYSTKKSPYWQYDFQVDGVRYTGSTSTESKSAAKEYVRKLRNRIAEGETKKPDLTVDEAFGLYWDQVGKHENNHKTTEGQLERLKAFFKAATLIRDIDREEVEKYIVRRRAQKATNRQTLVSNATVNREIELIKRVLKRVPIKYAKPTIDWSGIMLKEAPERIRELSEDEERRLFEKIDPDLANVAEFALLSSQRRDAVVTLLWSKVDLTGGRASVCRKGGGWHTFRLTPRMVALIASQPKVGPRVFTYRCERNAPARDDRPRRIKGERYPFSYAGWYRKWRRALNAAGIEDFRFHDLRHTGATRLVRATGNLKLAQRQLDHTTIATTARYAHATDDDVLQGLLAVESQNNPGRETGDAEKFNEDKKIA